MSRYVRMLSVVALLALGVAGAWFGSARAQDATPAAEETMSEGGITYDPITFAFGVNLPSSADLVAFRLTIEPGAPFPIEADDPSSGILIVESGALVVNVDASWTLTRGAGLLDALMATEGGDISGVAEVQEAGAEVTLEAGDAAYIPGNVSGEFRNDGAEPVVGLVFIVAPAGGMMAEATPTS